MIPVLYSPDETSFTSNGLGALSDAISCVVTEERNGVYELEMEYPIKGMHYTDIALDTIIYAEPADGKECQPFQIYKISVPINETVTIYAQHISYRLSFIPVAPVTCVGASETLNRIKDASVEGHPFSVWTDISNNESKYSRAVPSSFRECIGGTEGSFIDVFGGEVEWDKFTVKMHAHRGADNGVRISYSKNITDYKKEESNDGVVTAVYPYWVDSETGNVITCGVVYAVKNSGYDNVVGTTAPVWKANTYYRTKTTGYYKNDEDFAPTWLANTYYYLKTTGYYPVEGTTAPVWESNKYYSVNSYGFFSVSGETAPEWAYDTYYENTGTEEEPVFELLTYKPYDWNDNYTNYYTYIAPSYVLTTSEPQNWSTGYAGYFVYYDIAVQNPIYILTTAEPDDWEESFNSYYTYYVEAAGTVDYVVIESEPSDWSNNYTNYFVYWAELYSSDMPFTRTITLDTSSVFQYEPTERLLRRYASDYLKASSSTSTSNSVDISFIALWKTEEYKNIAPLERVNLCDTVTVDFINQNGIETQKLKVISIEYDVLSERYLQIKLGNPRSSLSNTITGISATIEAAVKETISTLENAINLHGQLLNGGLGGNVRINYNANGRPCEIVVGNSDDIAKMTQCLRINYKGIAFSKTGYEGPYTSIWSLDGEFDGQCIKAGSIDGNSIKADTIQASSITSAAKNELLQDVNDKVSSLESSVNELTDMSGWLHVENGHLYIGKEGSKIMLVEYNERISFIDTDTNDELAYFSNNRFYAPTATVENELVLGGYQINSDTNGLVFKWIGGDS